MMDACGPLSEATPAPDLKEEEDPPVRRERAPHRLLLLAALTAATAAPGAAPGVAAGAVRPGVVVGFGDSVAAGYGLSAAAAWPGSYPNRRFPPPTGAACTTTPAAYPCALARVSGGDVAASRDYAVQGAQSGGVLALQLPRALREMSTTARAAVTTVTLTVGANDIDFTRCLAAELTAVTDPCVTGSPGHLKVTAATQHGFNAGGSRFDGLDGLTSTIAKIVPALEAAFPRASVDVTDYYPFLAPVAPGARACSLFALPALSQLIATLKKDSLPAALLDAGRSLKNLSSTEIARQNRSFLVQQFLEQSLAGALSTGVGGDRRVTLVALPAFATHGVCAGAQAWAFGPTVSVKLAATKLKSVLPSLNSRFGTATCPYPDPSSEGVVAVFPPPTSSAAFRAVAGLVGLTGALSYSTNCFPHLTIAGQLAVAQAILEAPAALPT